MLKSILILTCCFLLRAPPPIWSNATPLLERHRLTTQPYLLQLSYQYHQLPDFNRDIYDLGLLIRGQNSNLKSINLAVHLSYHFLERDFFQLHQFSSAMAIDHHYWTMEFLHRYTTDFNQLDETYFHATLVGLMVKISMIAPFQLQLGYLPQYHWKKTRGQQLLHGGEVKIVFSDQIGQFGVLLHENSSDYQLTTYLQFGIRDYFYSRVSWAVRASYQINPSTVGISLAISIPEIEIGNTLIIKNTKAIQNYSFLAIPFSLFQTHSNFTSSHLSSINSTTNPTPIKRRLFKAWWEQVDAVQLQNFLKNNSKPRDTDSIWIKIVIHNRKQVKKLSDLIEVGFKDTNINLYYYLLMKKHFKELEDK